MDKEALNSVYLFIAELLGYKRGTVAGKIAHGIECYNKNILPEYCDDNLHEYMWLQRLYRELDVLAAYKLEHGTDVGFHWSVPIEIDASASMIGFYGALLGSKAMLEETNMAGDPEMLNDPWHREGLTRLQVKTVATPRLYASSKSAVELWSKNKVPYTQADVVAINNELKVGTLAIADKFKDFIVNNCNMKAALDVVIHNDRFRVNCNHYTRLGEVTFNYDLYCTESKSIRRIQHTKTKAIPDLERFKLYAPTLLIHNIDSQVMDKVAGKVMDRYGFCLDIHDALVLSPVAAEDARKWYAEAVTEIFQNRKLILMQFFKSVGIPASAMPEFDALLAGIEQINDDWHCRPHVLK